MRRDLREGVMIYVTENIKPNFAEIARQYNVDYRTVKKAYEEVKAGLKGRPSGRPKRPSLLDPFKQTIDSKLELNCSAASIFKFIQKKGFTGSYTLVKDYCRQTRRERVKKATIRIEHSPGLSAQVDWKEEMALVSSEGELFKFNIFLYVLPYSKLKYMTLTFDRSQDTLFSCLHDAFLHTGGIPTEIWFDNMKTVVDHTKSQFGHAVFNERFHEFCKDAGFTPIACRPFRPQTKGAVEALARTVERLRPYNTEFADGTELIELVHMLRDDLNHETSQATDEVPYLKWLDEEKEYLHRVPVNLLEPYFEENITRVVSKEAMINFRKCKYSVDPRYIGCTVAVEISNDEQRIHIYYNGEEIRTHSITTNSLNYDPQDQFNILKSDLLKGRTDEDISAYIREHMTDYDNL